MGDIGTVFNLALLAEQAALRSTMQKPDIEGHLWLYAITFENPLLIQKRSHVQLSWPYTKFGGEREVQRLSLAWSWLGGKK